MRFETGPAGRSEPGAERLGLAGEGGGTGIRKGGSRSR